MPPARVRRPRFFSLFLIAGIVFSLSFTFPASLISQTAPIFVAITSIDASAFPTVDAHVSVRDEKGDRVADLPAAAFALAENGAPVPAVTVSEDAVGVQVAFLVIPDETFNKHDDTGASRLDYVRRSIGEFVRDRPWMQNNLDDVSILFPEGPVVLHSTVGGELQAGLSGYVPGSSAGLSGNAFLSVVLSAVDVARPAGPRSGAASAVVVYAAGLSDVTHEQIDLAAQQAHDRGVPVYAVNVGPRLDPESVSAANFRRLAEGTGGGLVYFDRPENVTPLFETIAGNRTQYRLTYRSTLATSGQASLVVTVTPPGGTPAASNTAIFSLTVTPPQVTILGVPPDIQYEATALNNDSIASPARQLFKVQVVFPDAHPRNLKRLQLLVDGKVVSEITAPPFDAIAWDMTANTAAGTHQIQVQVTDELGLSAASTPAEVTVIVPALAPPASPLATVTAALAGPVAAVCAGGLALAVIAAGVIVLRRRGNLFAGINALFDRDASGPVATRHAPMSRSRPPEPRAGVSQADNAPTGPAFLELNESPGGKKVKFDLSGGAITLGRDPSAAAISFADRSVSRIHARLEMDGAGTFRLYDAGSTSGTWVNYEQVTAAGQALRHGDLINLGRIQLRFRLRSVEPSRGDTGPIIRPAGERPSGPPPDDTTEPFRPKPGK